MPEAARGLVEGDRRSIWPILVSGGLAIALLGAGFLRPAPRLIYNATASAPVGLYRVLTGAPLQRDDWVLAQTPASVRGLAAVRGYLPAGVPLIKRLAALPGDTVCVAAEIVSIDGTVVARRLAADRRGRRLPGWSGCHVLGVSEVFLLTAAAPDSFDGRYFGPTPASDVIGRLVPLWHS